jgi:hypothetical protein
MMRVYPLRRIQFYPGMVMWSWMFRDLDYLAQCDVEGRQP